MTNLKVGGRSTRIKVSNLIKLVWDSFYLPPSDTTDSSVDEECKEESINAAAKCMAIPKHIINFCRQVYRHAAQKFPERAETIIAEFLFGRWLMRELCVDANKNGLISEFPLVGYLRKNLDLVKEALTGLISSEVDYEYTMSELPAQIKQVCEKKRDQASLFMKTLLNNALTANDSTRAQDLPTERIPSSRVKSRAITASWSDISLIYDYYKVNEIPVASKGL